MSNLYYSLVDPYLPIFTEAQEITILMESIAALAFGQIHFDIHKIFGGVLAVNYNQPHSYE